VPLRALSRFWPELVFHCFGIGILSDTNLVLAYTNTVFTVRTRWSIVLTQPLTISDLGLAYNY